MTVVNGIVNKLFRNGMKTLSEENGCAPTDVQIGFRLTQTNDVEYAYLIDFGSIKNWTTIPFKKAADIKIDLLGYEGIAKEHISKEVQSMAYKLEQPILNTKVIVVDTGNELIACIYHNAELKKQLSLNDFLDGN